MKVNDDLTVTAWGRIWPAVISAAELHALIDEREDEGLYRINRRMFTDPAIFDLEMEHIFAGNWVYLAHESQLPNANDFLTAHIGRQPVILTRQPDGSLSAMLNACQHRGAVLELKTRGNKKLFVCPFHGWSYRNNGRLVSCGDVEAAGYSAGFDKGTLALKAVPRVESYRGFVFACMNADVGSLSDYLGEAKTFIGLIVDQDVHAELQVIPGPQTYTFDGNWKLQAENGVDGYHVNMIHGNYVLTTKNRERIAGANDVVKPLDVGNFQKLPGGYYAFENGHAVLWNELPNPEVRPSFPLRDFYVEKFGEERAYWMTNTWRNLFIFPNLFLMDQMSSQIRTFRPLGLEKTEVKALAFAPKHEAPELLPKRIRQYEDFFNASGLATPDDLAAFNATQAGFAALDAEWSDVSRGARNLISGPDDRAKRLGFKPQFCGTQLQDEGLFLNQHRQWLKILTEGLQKNDAIVREAAE
ncbi:MAG: Rieske 2Fe-2S domain-containing protein [Rhizorhabdus sp.]|uniref:Rieske 2Fe-2S domain-containing protein n=1 Tax=Rhizorhabdus sp. TaxID=1968843 RepID=UPI001B41712C|nr:Rieske 2Fe-2S domain-containing protein [Rhizorhabdus sp.]MBP8235922.1 Rieske 2Fe-2S domain-containing protein [Rhizorhabdus sp.]